MCGGGPSKSERDAQAQAADESKTLFNDYKTQFSNMQTFVTGFLQPALENMYTNPTGFGARAMADLTANVVNTVGAQAANAKQQEQAAFATSNMKGLPSGVDAVIQANISASAGNAVAQGKTKLDLANEEAKLQQKSQAQQDLLALPGLMGAAPQTAGLLTGSNQNSFNQADKINQESMAGDFWGNLGQGLIGGVIGGGLDFLTGGLSGLASGKGFLKGGAAGLSGGIS